MNRITFTLAQFSHVTNIARTAAPVVLMAAAHGAQAVEVQSFSFGCSNAGSMSSGSSGGSDKAGFDLKAGKGARSAAPAGGDTSAPAP